jgi:hypothetical protein
MDPKTFLHDLSVKTNVNIELLKDLYQNEKFMSLVRANKSTEAIVFIRSLPSGVGLREAQKIVQAFTTESG